MSVNYSSSTPAAEAKKKLCKYQTDGSNVSLEFDLDVKVNTSTATGTISADAIETIELSSNSTSPVADITRTLPAASGVSGFIVMVKKVDSGSGAVIVQGSGSPAEAIDSGTTWTLSNQYQYVRLLSDGTKWHVIGNN
jgi:hypothetical protein